MNTPWFGLRIHKILRSDNDRELHDHPFSFVSVILWGGYTQHTISSFDGRDIERFYRPGSVIFRRAEDAHRLTLKTPTWTFVIRGRMRRDWGFHTSDGWVHYRKFITSRGDRLAAGAGD